MPFPDASFERVYTQHVAMNIPDKRRLYAEIARVLKPGSYYGIYDLLQGPGSPSFPRSVGARSRHQLSHCTG